MATARSAMALMAAFAMVGKAANSIYVILFFLAAFYRYMSLPQLLFCFDSEIICSEMVRHGSFLHVIAKPLVLGTTNDEAVCRYTLIMVYKGCMILKTRGIPYYFQNFDSFYPLFFPKNIVKSLNFSQF